MGDKDVGVWLYPEFPQGMGLYLHRYTIRVLYKGEYYMFARFCSGYRAGEDLSLFIQKEVKYLINTLRKIVPGMHLYPSVV
jgi:hypothetical protein